MKPFVNWVIKCLVTVGYMAGTVVYGFKLGVVGDTLRTWSRWRKDGE